MAILLGLLSALLWGIADLLGRFAGRAVGPTRALFWYEIIGAVAVAAWFAISPGDAPWSGLRDAAWGSWAVVLAAGLVHLVGSFAITKGLTIGPIALVMPIVTAYGAVSAALAILAGEEMSMAGLAGIGVTVVGTGLAAIERRQERDGSTAGVPWALLAALCYGLSFWVQGAIMVPQFGGVGSAWLCLALGAAVMLLLAATVMPVIVELPPRDVALVTYGAGTVAVAGYLCLTLGFATGHIAIVAVLSTLSSVVTAFLGYTILGERLARHQWIGAALIILGVAIINAA